MVTLEIHKVFFKDLELGRNILHVPKIIRKSKMQLWELNI
jgi:hypothetical protein